MGTGLSDRLQAVYDMVTYGSVVADVGCDHAFLSIALVRDGRSPYAYACDINEGPLGRAEEHIEEAGLKDNIHTVLSDGLSELKSHVDSIVICGMGGSLITSILDKSIKKARSAKELILSPQSDSAKVRYWLRDHDFSLVEEKAVIDAGKYYEIIKAVPSDKVSGWGSADSFSMKYGPYLLSHHDPVLMKHLIVIDSRLKGILRKVDVNTARYHELKEEHDFIARVRER